MEGLSWKPFTTGRLHDDDTGEPIGNFQRYAFVQIPCFNKEKEECKTLLKQWIYNIKNMGRTQNIAFTEQNDISLLYYSTTVLQRAMRFLHYQTLRHKPTAV